MASAAITYTGISLATAFYFGKSVSTSTLCIRRSFLLRGNERMCCSQKWMLDTFILQSRKASCPFYSWGWLHWLHPGERQLQRELDELFPPSRRACVVSASHVRPPSRLFCRPLPCDGCHERLSPQRHGGSYNVFVSKYFLCGRLCSFNSGEYVEPLFVVPNVTLKMSLVRCAATAPHAIMNTFTPMRCRHAYSQNGRWSRTT